MLASPTRGFERSVHKHNGDLHVFCDWIQGSILFSDMRLSISDIVDTLLDRQIYEGQDLALDWTMNGWRELQRRHAWMAKDICYTIDDTWITRTKEWKEDPAEPFCVLLALATYYDWWSRECGHDYTEQGELFEWFTQEALEPQFAGWEAFRTGWSRSNPVNLRQIVGEILDRLGEVAGRLDLWSEDQAKELGLDILWYRPFPDRRTGISVYLMQCSSGANWKSKLTTPNLNVWRSLVQFATMPGRAFATPMSFLNREFEQNCRVLDGLFLDRNRLLCAYRHSAHWLSDPLAERINTWSTPRIDRLLARSQ